MDGIKELGRILRERGVPYQSGLLITLTVSDDPYKMVNWLNENPEATEAEMEMKALELNKARRGISREE